MTRMHVLGEKFEMEPAYLPAALACVSYITFAAAIYVAGDGGEASPLCGSVVLSLLMALFAAEIVTKSVQFGIINRAGITGLVFGVGMQMVLNYGIKYRALVPFGTWLILLSLFHFGEFISVALCCSQSLSLDSFLLNHSRSYHAAAVIAIVEYAVECRIVPGVKLHAVAQNLSLVGIGISLAGDLIRKTAIYQAGNSFNHLVQHQRRPGHALITSGVYAHFRHPSYFGWAMFALGTQVVLLNPLTFLLYLPAIYKFFSQRIRSEERSLLNMFGDEYAAYMHDVPFSGIPGCGLSVLEVDDIQRHLFDKNRTALVQQHSSPLDEECDPEIEADEDDSFEQLPTNSKE